RIDGTQPKGLQSEFDGAVILFVKREQLREETQGERRISVHLQRPVEEHDGICKIVGNQRLGKGPDTESLRIVHAASDRGLGVRYGGRLVLRKKSVAEPLLMAPCRIGVCRGIVGIKPQCFVEKLQRLVAISGRIRYRVWQSAQIEVVG